MRKYLFILFLSVFVSYMSAHPHLYIDMNVELDIDDGGLRGFWQDWTIQRSFGKKIGEIYDKNNNGRFDAEEIPLIEEEVFSNIRKYRYFTHISIGSSLFSPGEIRDFQAEKLDEHVRYRFYVPCLIPAEERKKDIEIVVYDESLYVSFGLTNISDPYNLNIDYDLAVARNGNIYSHSNDFGNAVIEIFMGKSEAAIGADNSTLYEESDLLYIDPDRREVLVSTENPFVSFGINLGDGTGNPFFR